MKAFNSSEFARFVVVGVVATCANLAMVLMVRFSLGYVLALICGTTTGLIVSFVFSKTFAFRSKSWERAPDELWRFLLVYATGALISWITAVIVGHHLLVGFVGGSDAELAGALIGAATMTFTSYFGHRFFTYRTFGAADRAKRLNI